MPHALPTRRSVLVAGLGALAAAGLSACKGSASPAPTPSATVDADTVVRRRVVDAKLALLGLYDAVGAAHPALASRLAPLAEEHRDHVRALGGNPAASAATPGVSTAPTSAAAPTHGASAVPATPPPASASQPGAASTSPQPSVPADPKAALDLLVGSEQAASDQRLTQVGDVSGELARLLGSIGACEAVHAELLPALATVRSGS
jgi:hypothetical protein